MGLPTSISMTAGAFVGWAILSPLAYYTGWASGEPLSGKDGSKAWLMWIALAIMCSESILGLVALFFTNADAAALKQWLHLSTWQQKLKLVRNRSQQPGILDTGRDRQESEDDEEHEPPSRLTSTRTVVIGLIASTILAVVLIQVAFTRTAAPIDAKHPSNTSPGSTILAILLALVLSILGARALGQTDLNPVSGLGKISQLVFAVTSPGNVVANLIAGGISEAGAMSAGDLLQDLQTGHLVGSAPHSQFKGQLIGSTLGVFVSVFAYQLYAKTYELPGTQFPAPSAGVWLNLARLLNNGHLPPKSGTFMVIFATVFAITGIMRTAARARQMKRGDAAHRAKSRWEVIADWLPSGIAFAVGILNTPNFSLARLVGGLIGYYYLRHVRQTASKFKPGGVRNGHSDELTPDEEAPTAASNDERTSLLRRRVVGDGDNENGDDTAPSSSNERGQAASSSSGPVLEGVFIIVVASGLVLGEGAASIVTLLLKQAGFQPLSCFGCRGGCASC
ncbi:OPT superfamily protein [Tilletia horrida]|uniref:OPT superfamily protein n=1 Tax=Tilletia horrida TaxID=155126 RepID=A0AAN6GJ33_9BASI|nr:OPT superfamily protein [Tilletia horrida]KAK0560244.1 OPT superfamily protein [Tilletia horrida]